MKVAVLGVGLIGGSLGLAAKRAGALVCGYDSDPGVCRRALEIGAIDVQAGDLATAVRDASVVFVATPVGTLPEIVRNALALAPDDCVVSDVGSTKQIVSGASDDPRFVGGHPLAGAETAGVQNARENLFEDATWCLIRGDKTDPRLYDRLRKLIESFGAHPAVIEPKVHDRLMASVSHMPHVLANVLVEQAVAVGAQKVGEGPPATGPSFRDATRVAGANTAIWTDIYLSNRDALISSLDEVQGRLNDFRGMLEAKDASAVMAWNERVRAERDALILAEDHELRVSVPNSRGVISDIAEAMLNAGVNIEEMTVNPSENHIWGIVVLSIRGDEDASRAEELISGLGFPVQRA